MSERQHSTLHPDDKPLVPKTTSDRSMPARGKWDGPTYYGRSQLKAAPFNNYVVGGYIFLAGLSGSSVLLGSLAEAAGGESGAAIGARARYLGTLAPTIGAGLLVYDLHTPQRFYNMLRVAKSTSPMSIGTWILMSFSAAALPSAAAQGLADLFPQADWLRTTARAAQVPAAIAGAGLSVYTAALLSATSTPTWAAAPEALSVRFGASSVASGSAALALGSGSGAMRGALTAITATALLVEAAATVAQDKEIARKGADEAKRTGWGRAEKIGVIGLGTVLPLGLFAVSRLFKDKKRRALAEDAACVAVLAGSAILRTSVMGVGDESAKRPEISFRYASPENLPEAVEDNRIPATDHRSLPYPEG
ncbi:MAG: NrfD/PsrC family molybdoenzyme membrane anchor subunit [Sphingomonas sp.]